ncbi:amidohydrolase [Actinotignum timonense]|uniref:amidohydrolase n=1 Tax=Actinotignum TaxID=1653174 RepID=UPI00237E2748|nr:MULTISPECIES: amidohydrolase [Actinotignum]MDE1654765.1 amidohydrolase [Actinotignum schaalii]MDK6905693.1 amidohydrolase [Actinotignum timonense]
MINIKEAVDYFTPWQEELYIHLHQHPELSMQEKETCDTIDAELTRLGYATQRIGGGVVGVLENGEGPAVLFRADIDGLPVKEATGLEYASTQTRTDTDGNEVPAMHACGHDFHISCALGAARIFAENREAWAGTYIALFQPGEETAAGARSMVADGLVDKIPAPDVALGQHVLAGPMRAGQVGTHAGAILSTGASVKVTLHGKGSHGSMPHLSIDPVVLAAAVVTRLQSVVAREINPFKMAVLTVGSIHAGSKSNIIPDTATLLINIRAYDMDVREQLLDGIKRTVTAECEAARAPQAPEFEIYDSYPLTNNDDATTAKVTQAFLAHFGEERVMDCGEVSASEDFSVIPDAFGIPYTYWGFGGFAEGAPTYPNHNPAFGPVLQPTLATGTEAAAVAALAWLARD